MASTLANPKSRDRKPAAQAASLHISWLDRAQSTLGLGLFGALLVYASLPPLDLWPLAWIAPVPWLLLIRQPQLSGRHPYRALWLAGFIFWLAAIHWLRLPHWTTYFGWLALSFYLAFYLPVFVALARVAVHRLRISIIIATPVIWTGLELARGHLLSGFTMGSLSHTQIYWPVVIQIADIFGDYGVSGLIMFVAACLARTIPWYGQRLTLWPIAPMVLVLSADIVYGFFPLDNQHLRPGPTVALIQGSIEMDVKEDERQVNQVLDQYLQLSRQALAQPKKLDLMVWPETMFRYPLMDFAPDFQPPPEWNTSPAERSRISRQNLIDLQHLFAREVDGAPQGPLPPPLLLGIDAAYFTNAHNDYFNSALFVDPQGTPLARYDKMHPVMFGEYIPLAEYLPFLYKITPLTGGLTSGKQPEAQKLGGVRYAPNICYETVIPHLIRRQVLALRAKGEEPDVLVNLTNDGWFHGSSEIDMHLACGVMRAVEMRKPLVIAANTGFSAYIDSDGRIVQKAQRMKPEVIIAEVNLDTRHSFYLDHGDWFSSLCLACCGGLAVVGIWGRGTGLKVKKSQADFD